MSVIVEIENPITEKIRKITGEASDHEAIKVALERFVRDYETKPKQNGSSSENSLDLPDEYLGEMLLFAKPIAHAIEKAFDCNRCGISVVGLEVPHAHIHLIPINAANDLNFTQAKPKASDETLKRVQEKILAHI